MPSGTGSTNTQRHEMSTSQPPSSGPSAAATLPSADQAPIARARSSLRSRASSIARLPGVSSAPPIPWTTRAITSTVMPGATAHTAEATVNTIVPMTNIRRRPTRSPSEPPRRISAASVRR